MALESLAAALDPGDHVTALVTGGDRPPRLAVTSRRTRLCDDIYAAHGWFWWSSAERIAPTSELSAAARAVSASLRGVRVLRDQM
ncbi:MAG TPA: hypothetical protein VE343_09965 [Streptosporangiaceae bacterium]|nr:hypothetical protein [Streptosporangiaceae bacterium]